MIIVPARGESFPAAAKNNTIGTSFCVLFFRGGGSLVKHWFNMFTRAGQLKEIVGNGKLFFL